MIITRSKQSYNIALKNISAKGNYTIDFDGSRQTIVRGKRKILKLSASTNTILTDESVNIKVLFSVVKAAFSRYIVKKTDFNPEIIASTHSSCYSNRELWEKIPKDAEIIHIDARHCYWRIAMLLGYITEKTYKEYLDNDELKTLRNIALSRITSKHKREYYLNHKKINVIECDLTLHTRLYDNIRHYTYNNSGQVKEAIPDYCIAYRVDGIYMLPDGLKKAKEIFKKNGLLFKIQKFVKVDEKYCVDENGELKKIL